MATFNFSKQTLPVGTQTLGPVTAADTEQSIALTISRTVTPNGLNSLTSATTLTLALDQSDDGGTTWQNLASMDTTGGTIPGKGGTGITQDTLWTQLNPGTSRQLRLTVTVGGTSVEVSGSIVTA